MADDPSDAFDKFAESIRDEQDKLDAAHDLRADKATAKRKRKPDDKREPDDATAAPPGSTPSPKDG